MIKQNKNEKATKLTTEELKEFRETYEGYQKAVFDLGTLEVEIDAFKKRLDELSGERIDLLNHINILNTKQQEIANKLGDKYGLKQVDLETGELK
jgi:hypothetical protein